ncbi:MAG: cytochrome C oxidase subunit IV family protein [Singulisphaera sp.]
MAETNLTADQEMHVESHAPYLKVFFALLIFTVMEYFYAMLPISFLALVVGLMAMAITKATLVGWYFMHLKFEGRWVYFMLVPAGVLATIFVLALYPDIGMQPISEQPASEEEVGVVVPGPPGVVPAVVRS